MSSTFKLELFVSDLAASVDFYQRVLGFTVDSAHPDGYTAMHRDGVRLALNRHASLPTDHPIYVASSDRPGRGLEMVLEVDDVTALCAHVQDQDWPLAHELMAQPWGATDFRVLDPDGYYWRITSRS